MLYNDIRDLTSVALAEVCPDVRREPRMIELDGTANKSGEARLDISATCRRVFDLSAQKYRGLEVGKCFRRRNGEEKALQKKALMVHSRLWSSRQLVAWEESVKLSIVGNAKCWQ